MSTIKVLNFKLFIIILLYFVISFIAFFVNVIYKTEIIYTHFYYIVIILHAFWFPNTIVLGLIYLSSIHIGFNIYSNHFITYSSVIRAAIYSFVGLITAYISNNEKKNCKKLNEKEAILKEVHHRIKNNINSVIAMLSYQSEESENVDVINALTVAENRLHSMSKLYDILYKSENVFSLSLNNYITQLIDDIKNTFYKKNDVTFKLKIIDKSIKVETVSKIGIIINELITNSMKYAFKNVDIPEISISITGNKKIIISYHDNGIGLPDEILHGNSKGFGIILIEKISKQMNGKIKYLNNNGATVIIELEL